MFDVGRSMLDVECAGPAMNNPLLSLPVRLAASFLAAALLAGCVSYTDQTEQLRAAWAVGAYPQAEKIATAAAQHSNRVDTVLWNLEAGAAARAAGDFPGSLRAFNAADGLFDYWDTQPDVSISRETAALLVNPTVLPYRGYDYDRIMESVYQALNYLALGQFDQARVELNRALERQQTAQAHNAARAAAAQQAAADSAAHTGYDAARAQNDPRFKAQYQQTYGPLDNLKYYTDYANPFATYLRALCLLARPLSPTDAESARVDFARVQAMIGSNEFIDADLALATQITTGAKLPPLTFVIYETGQAPDRVEQRIDIPLFIASRDVPYFGVAFPKLNFHPQYSPGLVVQTVGQPALRTALLCDMDSVVAQEFRNDLPEVVVKTLISAGLKAAAQFGVHQTTKDNDFLDSLTQISGLIYQVATNRADLRTWTTLPKQIQFARLPAPADHKLYLARAGVTESLEVDLPDSPVTIVLVKSTSPDGRLAIQTFSLR
jgi:hypothetical protein